MVFVLSNSIDLTDQIIENDINFEKILYKKSSKQGYDQHVLLVLTLESRTTINRLCRWMQIFHSIEDLLNPLKFSKENDVVIGSRYVKGGMIIGWDL